MSAPEIFRQHLIDPEICIRCNTCEETCPIKAISHDARNYVVDPSICRNCNDCLAPCPTGAIDSWRQVKSDQPWSLAAQLSWEALPAQDAGLYATGTAAESLSDSAGPVDERERIVAQASSGQGGPALPPWSAAHPYVNLYTLHKPAVATISGNYRLTEAGASCDIRHLVLDFGSAPFPVLEGQTIGIIVPGLDAAGRAHPIRLYSVASPRDGERPRYNNLSLTVKRVNEDHQGRLVHGLASNYLCDLRKGDRVQVVGPFGSTFLMPNHPGANLLMICTGTGSAPMRAMTERRRRRIELREGGQLLLFFGARAPEELPYFGPLSKLPREFIDVNFAFSRQPGAEKTYVQDRIRQRGADVARLLGDANTYVYICGLKGMEQGVDEAFADVCLEHGRDWAALRDILREQGRYHVETY